MAIVTGVRDTNNITQAKKVIDMADTIALLQPSAAPLTALLKQLKGNHRVVTNPKFSWLEDDLGARWDSINNGAGYDNAATSIVVANGDVFAINFIVKIPRTGEVMLVTGVATNTLTVKRGYGSTAAAAIVDKDPLVIIGNANQEGSGKLTLKSTQEVEVFNYTQIFKTPFGVTGTEGATKMYGGKDLSYQQKKKGIEHTVDINRAFYFGERKEDLTGTKPLRTAGGLLSFLKANSYDAGGAMTQANFDKNVSELAFRYGSHEKLLLCSARLLSVINGWAMGKLQVDQNAKRFGLNVLEYITPFGVFKLLYDPILEGAIYGGYGIVLDTENIAYAPLQGRDTRLETNIQNNDEDQRIDQYITEASIEVKMPKTHAVITGVTG